MFRLTCHKMFGKINVWFFPVHMTKPPLPQSHRGGHSRVSRVSVPPTARRPIVGYTNIIYTDMQMTLLKPGTHTGLRTA